jgi:hypothetical protein
MATMKARASIVAVLVAIAPMGAAGQSLPRASDGKPDLSGIWQAVNSAAWNILPHPAEAGVPGGLGVVEGNEIPYTPAAAAKQRANYANRAKLDPETQCYLPGVPRATYMGLPFQIVQTPSQILMLYEFDHTVRNVFMNSPHPSGSIQWWMGDSRARWDGDILVIDVIDFNDRTWFDRAGNHHSEALHVIERYTLLARDHINYEVTIEDPKVFTRQWKMSMPLYRRLDRDMRLLDYECVRFNEALHADPADAR